MEQPKRLEGETEVEFARRIKRRKMFPETVELGTCDNCGSKTVMSDGTCFTCGHGPKIG